MSWASLIPLLGSIGLGAVSGLGGSKGETKSTYNKGQLGLIDQIVSQLKSQGGAPDITQNQNYQQGSQWLNNLFNDENFFNSFEAPLQRQFQEQTVPELANRFAGMGSGGGTNSTAFRNQLAREGSNLSTNIAALRGNMQQQGVNQALGYAQQPFNNYQSLLSGALTPTQNVYQPPSSGFLGGIAPAFAGGAGIGFGNSWGQGQGGGGWEKLLSMLGGGSGNG